MIDIDAMPPDELRRRLREALLEIDALRRFVRSDTTPPLSPEGLRPFIIDNQTFTGATR